MKLYTYFRAMELIQNRCLAVGRNYPHSWDRKYLRLRDGLIRRMERVEIERDNLKADKVLLRQWLEEAEAKE